MVNLGETYAPNSVKIYYFTLHRTSVQTQTCYIYNIQLDRVPSIYNWTIDDIDDMQLDRVPSIYYWTIDDIDDMLVSSVHNLITGELIVLWMCLFSVGLVFVKNPQSKIRQPNETVTMCCGAISLRAEGASITNQWYVASEWNQLFSRTETSQSFH